MKQRDPLLHMHFIYAEVQPVAAIKIFFCKSSRKHSEIAAKNSKRLQSLSHGIRCRGDMEGHCTTGRNRQCGIPVETHMHAAGTVGGSVDIAILPCRQSRVVRHSTCAHGIVDGDEGTSPSTEGDHVVAVILPIGERRVAYRARQASVRCSSSRSLWSSQYRARWSQWRLKLPSRCHGIRIRRTRWGRHTGRPA